MTADNPNYGERVHALFAQLHHGRTLRGMSGAICGQAGAQVQGASMRLWLQTRGEHIVATGFEAYGCPYLLAAAESLCRWLENRRRAELSAWTWRIPETELGVPAAKRSRLLLLEDALKSAAVAWDRTLAVQAGG